MQQDPSALIKQARDHAVQSLAESGRVLPAAYMLVRKNPQTGAELTFATAIGMQLEAPFKSTEEYDELLDTLRAEAERLDAVAVVLCGEALAEIEDKGKFSTRRVFFVRMEDAHGVEHMHADIDAVTSHPPALGKLLASPDAVDDVAEPLLPARSRHVVQA